MSGLGTGDPFATVVGSAVFWVAAIAAVVSAFLMVSTVRNLVHAALCLTATLAGVAAIFGVLAADFLAVAQLVVYVGAIMVLMIFAIMMTPGQIDVPGLVGRGQAVGAFLVSVLVLAISAFVIVAHPWQVRSVAMDGSTVEPIGMLMFTRYVLPFEIASLLLTVALVGAIVIAKEEE